MNVVGFKKIVALLLDVVIITTGLGLLAIGAYYFSQDRSVAFLIVGAGLFAVCEFLRRSVDKESAKRETWVFIVIIIVLGLIVRWLLITRISGDIRVYFVPWYDYIVKNGGWRALENKVGGYSPFYSYYLVIVSYLPLQKIVAIKLLPIISDFILAFFVYKIVQLKYVNLPKISLLAFASVLFLPTLVVNGADYGQFDSTYIALIMGTLYYALLLVGGEQGSWRLVWYKFAAMSLFGLALFVKLHAVLLVLPLAILYIGRHIERRYFLLIPLVYAVLLLPSITVGRSFTDALNFNMIERSYKGKLAMGGPTIYHLVPYYPKTYYEGVGILSAMALIVILALLFQHKQITKDSLVRAAIISLFVVPFFLPAMRGRYFLPAEIAAIIYAFYFPRKWFVPVVLSAVMLIISNLYLNSQSTAFYKWYHLSIVVGILVAIVLKDFIVNEVVRKDN